MILYALLAISLIFISRKYELLYFLYLFYRNSRSDPVHKVCLVCDLILYALVKRPVVYWCIVVEIDTDVILCGKTILHA